MLAQRSLKVRKRWAMASPADVGGLSPDRHALYFDLIASYSVANGLHILFHVFVDDQFPRNPRRLAADSPPVRLRHLHRLVSERILVHLTRASHRPAFDGNRFAAQR